MSKRGFRVVLVGVLAYLVFLFVSLPAALVVPERLPGGVRMTGVSGTVWRGAAADLTWGQRVVGQLQWRFAPLALLQARVGVRVVLDGPGVHLQGVLMRPWFGRRVLVDHLQLALAADQLRGSGVPVALGGNIHVHIGHAAWAFGGTPQATGTAEWTGASLLAPLSLSLGTVQADLVPDRQGQQMRFSLQGGDLSGRGVLSLNQGLQYRLTGALTAISPAAEQLLGDLQGGAPRNSLRLDQAGRWSL